MTDYARIERQQLTDLLLVVGPDQPTVCTGWTTRDLAAHLVVRERRPDAMAGAVISRLAAHSEKVRTAKATQAYEDIVAEIRNPPWWSLVSNRLTDELANTLEFFIHHEDVRRARPEWAPRVLPQGEQEAIWKATKMTARFGLGKLHVPVLVRSPGFDDLEIGTSETQPPRAMLQGEPGEIALFVSGRQRVAKVEIQGQEDTTDVIRRAKLGK
jgi:uncharacterized protein (TIGR03085 family)